MGKKNKKTSAQCAEVYTVYSYQEIFEALYSNIEVYEALYSYKKTYEPHDAALSGFAPYPTLKVILQLWTNMQWRWTLSWINQIFWLEDGCMVLICLLQTCCSGHILWISRQDGSTRTPAALPSSLIHNSDIQERYRPLSIQFLSYLECKMIELLIHF